MLSQTRKVFFLGTSKGTVVGKRGVGWGMYLWRERRLYSNSNFHSWGDVLGTMNLERQDIYLISDPSLSVPPDLMIAGYGCIVFFIVCNFDIWVHTYIYSCGRYIASYVKKQSSSQ